MKMSAVFVFLLVASTAFSQGPSPNVAPSPPSDTGESSGFVSSGSYSDKDGPHSIDIKTVGLRDESRHRDIPMKIYIPKEDGKYPIVIFSHGTGGSKDSYVYVGKFLATHGFIVIHPSHIGSDSGILRVGMPMRNVFKIKQATKDPKNWKDRPLDVKFIVSNFSEIAKKVSGLDQKWDTKNVAVGGHPFGAYTALALAGAKVKIAGKLEDFSDPRVKAFFAMSPQGEGDMFNQDSWKKINAPVLIITGSKDRGLDGQKPEWRKQAFNEMSAGDKYLLFINEATHLSFADFVAGVKQVPIVHPAVEATLWAFLDFYLNGASSGHDYLLSDTLQKDTKGAARIDHR